MPPARLSDAQKAEARRLYLSSPDVTVDTLAASYGVSRTVMLRVLEGITRPRGPRPKTSMSTETMIRMRDGGMTLQQIGKQAGITHVAVIKRIQKYEREHGIDRVSTDRGK